MSCGSGPKAHRMSSCAIKSSVAMFSIASISCPATGMGNFPVMNEPGCLLVKKGVVSYRLPHAANQGLWICQRIHRKAIWKNRNNRRCPSHRHAKVNSLKGRIIGCLHLLASSSTSGHQSRNTDLGRLSTFHIKTNRSHRRNAAE